MAEKDKLAGEVMSNEELEQVVGGDGNQCIADNRFFEALGVDVVNLIGVEVAFGKYGIRYESNTGWDDNGYVFQGANSYAHHPRIAALGKVLAGMNYPGYSGEWWNLDYTKNFIRDHVSSDAV
mgnify:CR=1 FL=1